MASKAANLEKQVECPICLEQFKEPKVLSCLHSYCKSCLQKYVTKTSDKQHKITCPECRQETQVLSRSPMISEKQEQRQQYEHQLVHIATFACTYIGTDTINVKWPGPNLHLFSRNCISNFHINHPSILEATVVQKEYIECYAAFSSSSPSSCLLFFSFSFFSYLCGPPLF